MNAIQNRLNEANTLMPEPLKPLIPQTEAFQEFPLNAFSERMRKAAQALQEYSQAPLSMCCQSVLAVSSLLAQAHIQVIDLSGKAKPCSLFFMTIADSGERKSTVDGYVLKPLKDHIKNAQPAYQENYETYSREKKLYDACFKAIERKPKLTYQHRRQEVDKLGSMPLPPLKPDVLVQSPTIQGLFRLFVENAGYAGLFSAEGGTFLGGYSMQKDHSTETISLLSYLWDGEAITRTLAGEGVSKLYGKRLACHLLMQPIIAYPFLRNPINKQQGILGRFLVIQPPGLSGYRDNTKKPSPQAELHLVGYEAYVSGLLKLPFKTEGKQGNELMPRVVCLSRDAEARLRVFAQEIEVELKPEGLLRHISGFANKLPEHTVRIAGCMAWFDNPDVQQIDLAIIEDAIEIARFYSRETLRYSSYSEEDNAINDARMLWDWLKANWHEPLVSKACIQNSVPYGLRLDKYKRFKSAMKLLVDYGYLALLDEPVIINGHRRKEAYKIRLA
jgi:hypothetical protein